MSLNRTRRAHVIRCVSRLCQTTVPSVTVPLLGQFGSENGDAVVPAVEQIHTFPWPFPAAFDG